MCDMVSEANCHSKKISALVAKHAKLNVHYDMAARMVEGVADMEEADCAEDGAQLSYLALEESADKAELAATVKPAGEPADKARPAATVNPVGELVGTPRGSSELLCGKCGKTCKSKSGLTKHVKACKGAKRQQMSAPVAAATVTAEAGNEARPRPSKRARRKDGGLDTAPVAARRKHSAPDPKPESFYFHPPRSG